MKIKGSELQQFLDEAWPGKDWYWDHECFDEYPEPGVTYDTYELGNVLYQGKMGCDPTNGQGYDLGALIRAWRKTRTHDLLYVAVPKEFLQTFKEFCRANKVELKL